ncbi:MAG TPA: Crp/Fnr family transcriptional regulator [Acidobacteriaceae bacterium]|jgi:CRP-like cAMP-binding protein
MPAPKSNLLLSALSPQSRSEILLLSQESPLPVRTSLYVQDHTPKYAFFPISGFASVVVGLAEGGSVETSLIGREGLVGGMALLGSTRPLSQCFMQMGGSGFRIPFDALQRLFRTSEEIRTRILECVQQQSMTTSQLTACNKLHDAESRLARWLLMVADRTQETSFRLTQEFIAEMLGTRRTTVALVAGTLQRAGLIEYSRGKITIPSRENLATAACECYAVTQRLLDNLYRGSSANGITVPRDSLLATCEIVPMAGIRIP